MPPVAQEFENDQPGAEDDRGISQIKSVPVVIADMKIDEVSDAAAQDAVENISSCAAENQRHPALAEANRLRDLKRAARR